MKREWYHFLIDPITKGGFLLETFSSIPTRGFLVHGLVSTWVGLVGWVSDGFQF